jgi:hypothetical protein
MHPELALRQRAASRSLQRPEQLPHGSPCRTYGVLQARHRSFQDASTEQGDRQPKHTERSSPGSTGTTPRSFTPASTTQHQLTGKKASHKRHKPHSAKREMPSPCFTGICVTGSKRGTTTNALDPTELYDLLGLLISIRKST